MINRARLICTAAALAALAVSGCNILGPSESSLEISTPTPKPGAVIPTTLNGFQYFISRGSGVFSVPIKVTSNRQVDYAQLSVYLNDGSSGLGYCGQNLPDAPAWGPFEKGHTESVTISGWQISHVPCHVTSIHAFLHIRNNGLLTPPTDAETVVEGSLAVDYTFQ